jgi:hypothetical protein
MELVMPEGLKKTLPLVVPGGPGKPRTARAKHGIHSWVDSKRLPKGRSFAKTRRELGQLRTALIERRGGDEKITPEALILIDSAIEALGVQKLLGLYVKAYGIVDGQSAKRGRLELSPILSRNWVSYANVVRQAILALESIKGDGGEPVPTLAEIIRQVDQEEAEAQAAKAREQAAVGAGAGQDGQTAGCPSDGKGQPGAVTGDNGQGEAEQASALDGEGRSPDDEVEERIREVRREIAK